MPQDGLFFRVLRRFNMILVAIICLALIAFVGWHLYKTPAVRGSLLGYHHAVAKPLVTKAQVAIQPENYGTPDTIYGPHLNTVLVLNRNMPFPTAEAPEAFENYVPRQALNIMVLDEKTGTGHWLFADNKQIITMRDALYEGEAVARTTPATDTRPVLGMVMVVVPDAAAKTAKLQAIYAWTKQLGTAKKLVDTDEMVSISQTAENRYVVIYRKGPATRSATYSVPDFKLLSDVELPAAPK
jgi:hypothetical protein